MMAAGDFLESAIVHGNLYGTSRKQVLRDTSAGRDIILEVDVQGAASVRELMLDSVSIFILPPSFEVLRQRLLARGTDSPEELGLRLRNAPAELKAYSTFDYVIINDDAARAASQLAAIVSAERTRLERQERVVRDVVRSFEAL
jgi:guanylate kinase